LKNYLYGKMTWPEIKQAAKEERVAIVPIGTIEDHAMHLPVDTDNMIVEEVCHMAAQQIPDQVVVLPVVSYGINKHHFDFPGAIDIPSFAFIEFLLGITNSLVKHNFKRIILINGHGSNKDHVSIAAKRTVWENEGVICVATTPMMLMGNEEIEKIRQSPPGGISHAGELETSMYLYKYPEYVNMSLARKEYGLQESEFFGWDKCNGKVVFTDIWSKISEFGGVGDPTLASAESGKAFFECATDNLVAFVKEFKQWQIKERVNHQ